MKPPLTPEQLEALRRSDACTLANAIETFRERLRNEGFVDYSVRYALRAAITRDKAPTA